MIKEAFGVDRVTLLNSGFWPEYESGMKGLPNFKDRLRFFKLINKKGEFRERDLVEKDASFQQLIMYGIVLNNEGDFLLYERSSDSGYSEERLRGKVSIGVGGHMESRDKSLVQSLYRELGEELVVLEDGKQVDVSKAKRGIKDYADLSVIGVIKTDTDPVAQVHFGVLCFVKPKRPGVEMYIKTDNGENTRSRYVNDSQYLELVDSKRAEPEIWTRIAFEALTGVGAEG